MRKFLVIALAAVLVPLVPLGAADPATALPEAAPDVPAATAPLAVVTVLQDEVWSYTAGFRGRVVDVPTGWNRAVLVFRETPVGDPWDRLFAASIAGVEVLRGTTPRTDMTVRKDVTRYAALLPPGGTALVEGYTDTYVGAMRVTLTIEFYDDPSAALVEPAADSVHGVARFAGMCNGGTLTIPATFPVDAPSAATVEFYVSSHGPEEFWFQANPTRPRVFTMIVDGVPVAQVTAMPYTYAFLGFSGATGERVHGPMWWTAQQALDVAGVPDGVGEIPAYRATIAPEHLDLFAGARTVEIALSQSATNRCVWVTSASVLLSS